ncbi:hypothetical protein CGC20_5430 [Leishmania donovani]|uniref:Flagellar attachment zone protein 1 conserved domain-containing protein n=1 Tax=Leishmania donovani TaxID=5661 RepID=A0A504XWS4_LEIDO|nr:hypothetical protein CGC20_5430 [Leishmania donovani]
MTAVSVNENELVHLSVGDFVAILTHHMKDGKLHWILGSVETPPYLRDVEIRLWAKQRFEYYDEGDAPADPETAALMDRIAQVKDELRKSIDQAEDLTEQLRDRRAAIIQKIAEADRYVAESKAVRDAARDDVESISDRNWQELKSYRIPPKMVSVIIRAVMLLLSEDEARTWPHMQRVLRDFYFKRRITSYDPVTQLSPERRDYILQECVSKKSFRYDRAMQGSVAVGPIYYWVLAQLDSGEAQSQKEDVEQEKIARQKELRGVLKQISEQQERISEYQELMDDLDDQLRLCNQRNSDGSSVASHSRRRISISDRYAESFAAREGKEYLRPAFYAWKPTDRVIIVLRKNIVCNFGAVTSQEQEEGYNMSEPQIRMLDEALIRSQQALETICGDNEGEDDALEEDMLKQNDNETDHTVRKDEDILEERQRNAAEGKPTPIPTPQASDTNKVGIGAAEATSKLQRTFEGKNWHRILDRKREAIEAAFTEDSSECLKVPPYSIMIESLMVGSLIVDFSAQHDGQRSDAELQERVKTFEFPKVMSLYDEEDEEDDDGPEHQMKFGGDRWADMTPEHHDEIEAAFLADTSAATGALQDEIAVQDIRADADEGLTVDYSLLDKDRDPEEVQEQVDAYAYPAVWALYQRLAGLDAAAPIHQVRFRGERWADIMPGAEEAIRQAFAEDTADALGIAPQQVIPDEIRYEKGLTVPYTVLDCSLDGDEVDAKAEDYHYPNTWALYDRLVAEAVGAAYQKSFEGEHWETVLHAARPEVSEAFCTDTANAVKSEPGDVDPRSVDTDQNRLLVSYNVGDSQQRADEVRADTQEYPYPEVWALYQLVIAEEAEGTRKLSQTFDGEAWDAINAEMPEQVREAFTEDVSVATRVNPACVTIRDIKTSKKGMTVEYGIVREEGQSAYATRKAAKNFDYPVTWNLYEANKKSAPGHALSGFGEGESAIFERRFEGDDWDIVVEGCREELSDAFRADTARVLGVPKQSVRIISIEIGSPNVKYQLVDPPCEDREIERRMEEDELPEVMDLYRRCTRAEAEGATPALQDLEAMPPKVFDGDEWGFVMANQRAELEKAFVKDTADALGVSDDQVRVKEMKVGPYALRVQYSVRDCPSDEAAAQATVEDYAYPSMWEIYPDEEDLGNCQKTFDGTGWEAIVASREDDVRAAFAKDVAEALKAGEQSVVVKSVHANAEGLEVRYNVTSEACDSEQIMEMQQEYGYPNTWALYEEDEGNWVTTSHQLGFEGEDWVYVVQDKMPELQEAFVSCTAELFHLRPEHITNTKYTLGSLIVDFELTHPARMSEEEIRRQLVTCPYEPVWELYGYHPWVPTEVTETTHNICFEGPGWATVLESQREELEECFKQGTAAALEVEPSDVRIDSADCAEECLFIRTTVTHHIFQDNELLQEQLTRYPYEEVWKLYAEDPNQSWTVTSHQVGFDGDDWMYIVSAKKEALEKAFRTCTGESLDLTDEHITNIVFEANEAALLTTFEVKHPKEQSEKEVNRRLAECDYMRVWELYIDHPYNPEENEVTSHEIGFEGDEWNKVIATQLKQLEEAIMLDTSEALEVTPNDITSITTSFENGNLLIVRLNIQHPVLQDEELIKEQLSRYPYERVWALYEDAPITPLSEEDAVRFNGTGEGESAVFERRFEGDDWDIVVEGCPEELSDAFRAEAARVLGVPKQSVRIISTEIGSLIVKYQIVDPPCEDREIERRMEEDELPEVLNLYRRRIRAEDEGATTTSRVKPEGKKITTLEDCGFEGEDWDYVWSIKQEAMRTAFAKGVADALGIKPTDIQNINMEKSADGIVLGANVTHPLTQDYQMIRQTLKNHPFEELWALYETRPYNPAESVTTEHLIYFEGEEWDAVMAGKREEVVEAIRKDTASALELPVDDVVSVCTKVEPTGLAATVVVSHSPLQDDELIHEELTKYDYERVWALYCPESGPLHGTKHFDGLNWADVIGSDKDGVMQAFRDDTAAAVSMRPDDVDVDDIRTTGLGMDVDYTVNLANTSGEDIEHTLRTYPYPNVWGHYRVEDEITTQQNCGFKGEDWDYVWSIKQEAMRTAFAKGVADALGIKPTDIQNINMEKSADGIVLGANVTHPLTQDYQMIRQTLKKHPFEELWALYETRPYNPAESVTTEHLIYFEGEEWDAVMAGKREEVVEAIRKDTASALELPVDDVVSVCTKVEPTGLAATVVVSHSPLQDDELIHEELTKYDYERVWALYCPESGPLHGTKHFDGLNWADVIGSDKDGVMQAFRDDTAAAVSMRPDDVDVDDIRTTGLGMDVDYTVNLANTSGEDIEHTLRTYPYPNVWGHYRVEDEITTQQNCGFKGEDWDYVWSIKQEAMRTAFAKGVADALGIKPTDIQNINMEKSADGIVLGANVTHPLTQDYQMIRQTLKKHPFEELWALYETRPCGQGDLKSALGGTGDRESGRLQRLFEGDDWDLVLEGCPEDATDAFRKGVADSVHVSKSDVVVMAWHLGSLIMSYKVRNCDMEDAEINDRVRAHEFPELMALYRARVRHGQKGEGGATEGSPMRKEKVITVDIVDEAEVPEGYTRVALSVSFEGELWEKIVKTRTQELADAFRADTAKSIGAALGDIHIRECFVSKVLLLVHFSARYEATVSEAELRKKIDEHSYDNVWALYDEMEDALAADMSEVMVKHFVGVHWDFAMEACPTLVEEAFKEDTANVLRTHASKVLVEDIALGSLIVRFRVQGLTISEAEAMQMTGNYAYPKVWALYMSCEEANGRASLKSHKNGSGGGLSRRRAEQLVAEEGVESQDTVTYLRKALADARRERDMYMEQVEQAEEAQRATEATPSSAVVLGGRTDLHVGDFVGFQRISPSKEWKLSLGKVIALPTTLTVKVAHFDAVNETTVTQDPISEQMVRQKAAEKGKMDIWHNREALRENLAQESAKEKAATQRLLAARDQTVTRQMATGDKVTVSLENLDNARRGLREVPVKEWSLLRKSCLPSAEIIGVMRSVMLILYEDSVTKWEGIQEVMHREDFMERILSWDCTATPMSLSRRKRIVALCAGKDVEGAPSKKRRRSGARSRSPSCPLVVAAKSSNSSNVAILDKSVRAWINAQLSCSEASREQEMVINSCFAEQQEQRALLREINDMRVGISFIEVQMLEMKNAILGIDDAPKPIMPLDAYPTDTVFYKRSYPDADSRFVQEIILREAVIHNFGHIAEEDAEGYVRLNPTQVELLRDAVVSANVRHDAEEMEELLARKEREEQEMAELRSRVNQLRNKVSLTAEEEEELAQLEKLLADAERRHHATLSRIADLYACGRGAREITLAIKRPEFCYTRLHCRMSGDWETILSDPERYGEMIAAFCDDVSTLLNIPASYVLDIDACCGSLLIDFTVKHSGDLDDEQLQDLVNNGCFSALCMFYEKVTFKKTSPLNTSQQQLAYDLEQRFNGPAPISGMGIKQILADYYNADGTLDEEFSDEVKAHMDYRKAFITIPPLREDYDDVAVRGPFEQHAEDEGETLSAAVPMSIMASSVGGNRYKEEDESAGATQMSIGLTDTGNAAHDMTESAPATEVYGRSINGTDNAQPAVDAAAPAAPTVSAPAEVRRPGAPSSDAGSFSKSSEITKASSAVTLSTSSSASGKFFKVATMRATP